MRGSFPKTLILSISILGMFAFCSLARADLPDGIRVDSETIFKQKTAFSGESYEELSAFLYGGDESYASKLRELNDDKTKLNAKKEISYPRPLYQVRRGDTYQTIGGLWVNGSAKGYRRLLRMNPHIQDPNHLKIGTLITLPRIPRDEERARFKEVFFANNPNLLNAPEVARPKSRGLASKSIQRQPSGSAADGTSEITSYSKQCESSVYEPQSAQERLELVQWYLDRQEGEPDRDRMDAMIRDLLKHEHEGWNAYYLAGQYYLRTGRAEKAEGLFKRALEDDKAPIQVGLFYIKAGKKSGTEVPEAEQSKLFERFPPLQSIVESNLRIS